MDDSSRTVEASEIEGHVVSEAERAAEPYEGMIFDSEDAGRAFYDEYAARAAFGTRVLSSRKSECDGSIISRGLGCRNISNNQKLANIPNEVGEKRRAGCTAMFLLKRESAGRWVVRKFVREHNHPLVLSLPRKRPTFDEKDKRIQELTSELRVKKRLSAAYREQLLILMKDVDNHNYHFTAKIKSIHDTLKELDSRKLELVNENNPTS